MTIAPDPKLFATPTLLVVDSASRVIGSWVGLQSESRQHEIEALIRRPS